MARPSITINGTEYDPQTGQPVKKPTTSHAPLHKIAGPTTDKIHTTTQRSKTLNRRILKTSDITPARRARSSELTVAPAHQISRFTPASKPVVTKKTISTDIGPQPHPIAAKAAVTQLQRKQTEVTPKQPKAARVIKEEAIQEAIAKTPPRPKKPHTTPKRPFAARHIKALSIIGACLVVVLIGAFITFANLPLLEVRVAASSAGINATYPSYRPDGYHFENGSISSMQGEVSMSFHANSGPTHFTLSETESSWDASAVLADFVTPAVGNNYVAYTTEGLTIYTFKDTAAWVNAGLLYKITGDAPLSGDQIQQIATSL